MSEAPVKKEEPVKVEDPVKADPPVKKDSQSLVTNQARVSAVVFAGSVTTLIVSALSHFANLTISGPDAIALGTVISGIVGYVTKDGSEQPTQSKESTK